MKKIKPKSQIYILFLITFIFPPIMWSILTTYIGLFNISEILQIMIFSPAGGIYCVIFIIIIFKIFNKKIKIIENYLINQEKDKLELVQKTIFQIPLIFLIGQLIYGMIGPNIAMFGNSFIDELEYLLAWLLSFFNTTVLIIPFLMIAIAKLDKWTKDIPLPSNNRNILSFRTRMVIGLLLPAVGALVFLLISFIGLIYSNSSIDFSTLIKKLLIVTSLCFFILLVSLLTIGKQIINQIQKTRQLAVSLVNNKLNIKMDVTERDEIGQLTEALNETSDTLYYLTLINEKNINVLKDENKQRKHAEEQLKKFAEQLMQAENLSAMGELTSEIAHELKQPLNLIKIKSQIVGRNIKKNIVEKEKIEESMLEIKGQVDKMSNIIDQMRIYKGPKKESAFEEIEINRLLESIMKFYNEQLIEKQIKIIKNFENDLPQLNANPNRLEQVITNLVTNSIKALSKNREQDKKITIKTYENTKEHSTLNQNSITIEINDNALGIPEEFEDKIFEPFFTTKAPDEGTGLGLAISKKIIEEHNGSITLENKVGVGVTFKIELPLSA